jgi:photosystem II stability/assembly factor-like uncharacterized protein
MQTSLLSLTLCNVALAVLLLASGVRPAYSQVYWQEVGDSIAYEPYFLTAEYGFMYAGMWNWDGSVGNGVNPHNHLTPQIWRTVDSGKTWIESESYGGMMGFLNSLHFANSRVGYAALRQGETARKDHPASGGIYKTEDSGRSWRKITPVNYGFEDVYVLGDTLLASATLSSDRISDDQVDNTVASGMHRSTDGGKTWKIYPPQEVSCGFDIAGNDAGLIITGAWIGAGTLSISTDFGSTWKGVVPPPQFTGIGSYYVPRFSNRVFATSGYIVWSSEDAGQTWERSYEEKEPTSVLHAVAGAGCVVYAQSINQMLRSTDWGATWKVVNGQGASTFRAMSVVGNGATVYTRHVLYPHLGDWYDVWYRPLYRTTTGGDGQLSPVLKGETIGVQYALKSSPVSVPSGADTIRTRLCDSARINVKFQYSSECNYAWLYDVELDGLSKDQYTSSISSRRNVPIINDSAWLSIVPNKAGTYSLKIRVRFEQDDSRIRDTLFSIVLVVESNPSTFTLDAKNTFDMGFQRLCNVSTVRDSFSISALGCEPYEVKSVRFEDGSTNSGYTFTTAASALTLTPDGRKRFFHISFLPNRAGQFDGKIIIERESGSDTILVTATAEDDDRDLLLKSNIITAQACESSEAMIDLTNTSCRLMTLEAMDIPAPLELLPNQLPIGIPAGKSVQLKVRFTPISEGPQRVDALAHLKFVGQTETIDFDTILPLNVVGLPGTPLTVTTDTSINIGDVSICADKSFTVPIQSLGCDTLSITSTTLSALDKGYTITAMPNAIVPVNESTNATLLFTPPSAIGAYTTDLIITTNAGTRKVTLIANVAPGNKVLASSVTTLNFGETNICEERDSVIQLTNNGCDTLRITEANASDDFIVGGEYPIVLAPGQSIDVPVSTVLDTAGKPTQFSGEVIFTSTADNALPPITLTRSLVYPTKLRLEAVDEASGKAGDIVKFRILLEGQVPSTMTALHFDFLHNNDLLGFESLSSQDLTITSTTGNDAQVQRFTLSPVREAGVLGEISFKAFLAEAEQTTLSFDNISLEAEGVTFAPECIAVISDSGSRFNYIYTCGDNIIRDRLNGMRLIKSITPNPASGEIRVELSTQHAEITLIDALGKERVRTTEARIDVRDLPNGVYYVRVASAGSVETRRVVVSH